MEFIRTLFVVGVGDTELWAPFIVRVGLGLAMLTHGYPKLFKNFGQFSGYVASLKWPAPKLFAALAAIAEFGGGLALVVGFMVKPVALLLAIYMALVILSAHKGQKFSAWELAFLYFIAFLALWAMNHPGIFALDNIFSIY